MAGTKTLWTQGRSPRTLVLSAAVAVTASFVALDLMADGRLGWVFDLGFGLSMLAAALLIRPRDFYSVGVTPPLLMLGVLAVTAFFDRGAVSQDGEPVIQAVVSGLAHHSPALGIAYAVTLMVIGIRRVAEMNQGSLRGLKQATTDAARLAAQEALARAPQPPRPNFRQGLGDGFAKLKSLRPPARIVKPVAPAPTAEAEEGPNDYYVELLAAQAVREPRAAAQTGLPETELLKRRVELEEIDTTVYMPRQPNYDGPIRRAV